MSWRVTLHCTRAEAEALPETEDLFAFSDAPPVIVADEPDPHAPDDWRIHAYFAEQPTTQELVLLRRLAKDGEPEVEHLEDTTDWVVKSQSGLEPIRAGRFFVHTPMHYVDRPTDTVNFEIDAGLAFGTGQHDTTAGCLAMLDRLARQGAAPRNIADIGTGTGLLAFAAMHLWPAAKMIASATSSGGSSWWLAMRRARSSASNGCIAEPIAPGSIRVTRISSGISSLRKVSAKEATPPLAAL